MQQAIFFDHHVRDINRSSENDDNFRETHIPLIPVNQGRGRVLVAIFQGLFREIRLIDRFANNSFIFLQGEPM